MMGRVVTFLVLASPALALDLSPPGGTLAAQIESPGDSVRLPRKPWTSAIAFEGTDGTIRKTVYNVSDPNLTTLQLVSPLRDRLFEAGYEEVFSCADAACGGFDFRFQLDLLPAPEMYVDLGNFRYVLMENVEAEPRLISFLASSSATTAYVHVTEVAAMGDFVFNTDPQIEPKTIAKTREGLVATLIASGHTILPDLEFATGSADLGPGPFASLQTIAEWLRSEASARIVLVGHTDSVGSLDANAELSRQRATSVLNRLVETHGVDREQIQADGAGALSPVASNLSSQGRSANRRVEVVLLSL